MNRLTELCLPVAFAPVLILTVVPSGLAYAHHRVIEAAPDSTGPALNDPTTLVLPVAKLMPGIVFKRGR